MNGIEKYKQVAEPCHKSGLKPQRVPGMVISIDGGMLVPLPGVITESSLRRDHLPLIHRRHGFGILFSVVTILVPILEAFLLG